MAVSGNQKTRIGGSISGTGNNAPIVAKSVASSSSVTTSFLFKWHLGNVTGATVASRVMEIKPISRIMDIKYITRIMKILKR